VHGSSLWLNSSEQEFFSIQVRSNAIQRRPIHRFRPSDGSEGLREERAARFANNRTERRASRADQQEPVALLFAISHRVLFSWQREITRWFDFRCVRTANSEVSVVLDAVREVVEGHSPLGYPVVFAERVVTEAQLRAGEPFDCQLQAAVTDPAGGRMAVFTLSSSTGRGWLELSGVFGRLVASVDFG